MDKFSSIAVLAGFAGVGLIGAAVFSSSKDDEDNEVDEDVDDDDDDENDNDDEDEEDYKDDKDSVDHDDDDNDKDDEVDDDYKDDEDDDDYKDHEDGEDDKDDEDDEDDEDEEDEEDDEDDEDVEDDEDDEDEEVNDEDEQERKEKENRQSKRSPFAHVLVLKVIVFCIYVFYAIIQHPCILLWRRCERERGDHEKRELCEQQEMEKRANEDRESRERQEMERSANEERERREREEKERRANEERELWEREEREHMEKPRQTQNANQREASQGTSSRASLPPQGNRNNNKNNSKKKMTNQEYFYKFMKVLQRLLQAIYGSDTGPILKLFVKPKLTEGQKKYLIKVVKTLENFTTLEAVLEIVIIIFKDHMSSDINFENFLSLLEFVRSYLNDKVNEIQTETNAYIEGTFEERRARILCEIMTDSLVVRSVVLLFRQLAAEIAAECTAPNNLSPDFRDMFAKVYHYYKHRRISDLPNYENENICVPDEDKPFLPENGILSVKQYFYWGRQYLAKLKNKIRYKAEVENASPTVTVTCRYEVFVVLFGRRLRIVVKVRAGKLVLSTVFFDDECHTGDADDFEHLDIQEK